jgi:hypothetical protein
MRVVGIVASVTFMASMAWADDIVKLPGETIDAMNTPNARGNVLKDLCLVSEGELANFASCSPSTEELERITFSLPADAVTCGPDEFYRAVTIADTDDGTPIKSDPSVDRLHVKVDACQPDPPTLLP